MLIDYNKLSAISKTIEPTKPIFMLNVLRFKEIATYQSTDPSYASLPTVSGHEAYFSRYIPTILPMMGSAAPIFLGKAIASVLASNAATNQNQDGGFQDINSKDIVQADWDNVAIVRYENFKQFKDMIENEEYKKKAMPHRVAAIENYILIVCEEVQL